MYTLSSVSFHCSALRRRSEQRSLGLDFALKHCAGGPSDQHLQAYAVLQQRMAKDRLAGIVTAIEGTVTAIGGGPGSNSGLASVYVPSTTIDVPSHTTTSTSRTGKKGRSKSGEVCSSCHLLEDQ